jgi:carbamate kinase
VQADQHNRGWEFKLFPGLGYQRVVPGLMPKKVIEATQVRHMLERGVIVICAGGGGIPVRSDENGDLIGVDAVVDKAYTCVLLAQEIDCDLIIFVSPRDRIVGSYDLNLTNGLQEIDLKKIDTLINRYEMEDTMRHKLIASKQFLQQGGNKTVLILPPDQLGADPSSCCGVQLGSEAYVTSFRSQL